MDMDDIDIDSLIDDLKQGNLQSGNDTSTSVLSSDRVNDYIMDVTSRIISNGMQTLESVQRDLLTTKEGETIEAYSSLLKSVVHAVDTINKINLQQMKQKASKELKKIDYQAKKKLLQTQLKSEEEHPRNSSTNILVTTREDFFKMVQNIEDKNSLKTIEAEVIEEK